MIVKESRIAAVLPAALIHFCSHFANLPHHTSTKVYVSGSTHSISIMAFQTLSSVAFSSSTCHEALSAIKIRIRTTASQSQENSQKVILQSLDLSNKEHIILWVACCLGFFWSLRAGEFAVNSPENPATHLTLEDFQVHFRFNLSCLRMRIKCSKTDPFC